MLTDPTLQDVTSILASNHSQSTRELIRSLWDRVRDLEVRLDAQVAITEATRRAVQREPA